MTKFCVKATGNGRKVKWAELKKGKLVDANAPWWHLSLTTVLTDVVTDVIDLCQVIDGDSRVEMIVPNGFINTGFVLAIVGNTFNVTCARHLVRGWFPLNPIAAEFGSNYDVIVSIECDTDSDAIKIVDTLTSKYECLPIA